MYKNTNNNNNYNDKILCEAIRLLKRFTKVSGLENYCLHNESNPVPVLVKWLLFQNLSPAQLLSALKKY